MEKFKKIFKKTSRIVPIMFTFSFAESCGVDAEEESQGAEQLTTDIESHLEKYLEPYLEENRGKLQRFRGKEIAIRPSNEAIEIMRMALEKLNSRRDSDKGFVFTPFYIAPMVSRIILKLTGVEVNIESNTIGSYIPGLDSTMLSSTIVTKDRLDKYISYLDAGNVIEAQQTLKEIYQDSVWFYSLMNQLFIDALTEVVKESTINESLQPYSVDDE